MARVIVTGTLHHDFAGASGGPKLSHGSRGHLPSRRRKIAEAAEIASVDSSVDDGSS
jgi:hypothetical protein